MQLGVSEASVYNWETGRSEPSVRHWPAIIAFLGAYPFRVETLAERLLAYRREHGISRRELAEQLGVDEGTILRRERGYEVGKVLSHEMVMAVLKGYRAGF